MNNMNYFLSFMCANLKMQASDSQGYPPVGFVFIG